MATTQRFGLDKFGGPYGGAITDDAGKYSTRDRDIIDRVLAALEGHAHDATAGAQALSAPTAVPSAVLGTGGALPSGDTYYYSVGFVDKYGLETARSPEVTIAMPGIPAADTPPTPTGRSVNGSTLPLGTYYYALTVVAGGAESELGPRAIITVQPSVQDPVNQLLIADQNQVDVGLPALPAGGDGFNVWRMSVNDSGWTKVGSSVTGATFADTGFPTGANLLDPATQPPEVGGTSGATSKVTVTVAGADNPAVRAWRLYRTDSSGAYAPSSLVVEVVPTTQGGTCPTSVDDLGGILLAGMPLTASTTLQPSRPVAGGGGGGGGGGAPVFPEDNEYDGPDLAAPIPLVAGTAVPVRLSQESPSGASVMWQRAASDNLDGHGAGGYVIMRADGRYDLSVNLTVTGLVAGDVIVLETTNGRDYAACVLPPTRAVCEVGDTQLNAVLLLRAVRGNPGYTVGFKATLRSAAGTTTAQITEARTEFQLVYGTPATAGVAPGPASAVVATTDGSGNHVLNWSMPAYSPTAHGLVTYYDVAVTDPNGTALPTQTLLGSTTATVLATAATVPGNYTVSVTAYNTYGRAAAATGTFTV